MVGRTAHRNLHVAPLHFLLLAAPLVVLFGLDLLLDLFGDSTLPIAATVPDDEARIVELTGRYRYLAAFAFFGAVSVAVLAIFGIDLAANYTRASVLYALLALVAMLIAGALLAGVESQLPWQTPAHRMLGGDFFETALAGGRVNVCGACLETCGDAAPAGLCALCGTMECRAGGFAVFRALAEPTNTLTSFSASAGFAGLILSLGRSDPGRGATREQLAAEAADLWAGERIARRYLFCLGGLLTAGMTFLMAWMHWPAALIADPGERAAYLDLVGALSLYIGVGYSVLIAAGYVPVTLLHVLRIEAFERRVDRLTLESHETFDRPSVPKLRYVEGLNRILAVLSPILASAIGSFGQGVLFG